MTTIAIYLAAALAEIVGCFAFWAWLRLGHSVFWVIVGVASLTVFAWLLTLSPSEMSGRAFAVYGGIYIVSSLVWMWMVDGQRPDQWDILGGAIALAGAGVILWGPRGV